jgi:hypothetical protein
VFSLQPCVRVPVYSWIRLRVENSNQDDHLFIPPGNVTRLSPHTVFIARVTFTISVINKYTGIILCDLLRIGKGCIKYPKKELLLSIFLAECFQARASWDRDGTDCLAVRTFELEYVKDGTDCLAVRTFELEYVKGFYIRVQFV